MSTEVLIEIVDTYGVLAVNFILFPALFLFFASFSFHLLLSEYVIPPNKCCIFHRCKMNHMYAQCIMTLVEFCLWKLLLCPRP